MSDSTSRKIDKGIYRHNKTGHLYEVTGLALHTENDEQLVIYRRVDTGDIPYEYFARDYDMFVELVTIHGKTMPRFEKADLPNTQLA